MPSEEMEPPFDCRDLTVGCADCGRTLYRVTDDPDVTHRCARCTATRNHNRHR